MFLEFILIYITLNITFKNVLGIYFLMSLCFVCSLCGVRTNYITSKNWQGNYKLNYITSKDTLKNVSGIQNVIIYVGTVNVQGKTKGQKLKGKIVS